MSQRPIIASCQIFVIFAVLHAPKVVRAAPVSIQEFVEQKHRWPDFVGTQWTLTGRYLGINRTGMRFTNCDLPFVFADPDAIPRTSSPVVQVTGTLEKVKGKLQFRVQSLRSYPDDFEVLRAKRAEIDSSEAEQWYKLAEWITQRAEFYNDSKLKEEAADINLQGIKAEYRNLDPSDQGALEKLLAKAKRMNVSNELIDELVHAQHHQRFTELVDGNPSDDEFADLLVSMSREFPSAAVALESGYPQQVAEHYFEDPVRAFKSANEERRGLLVRLLYLEVMKRRLMRMARDDGSNGFEVADNLRANVPELPMLADKYEQQAVDYQLDKVRLMTRSQLLDLIDQLEMRNRAEEIPTAKKKWLLAREAIYRNQGAGGLAQLGDSWMELLGDVDAATAFYVESWKTDPDFQPAHDWLTAHGYVLFDDEWIPADQMPKNPKSRIERAVEEGRVEKGMTESQVRAAFGARPTSQSRFASAGKITELWVFESAGVIVRFSRRNRPGEGRVIAVEPLTVDLSRNESGDR